MKKVLLLMAFALPFVFISCGDDKDEPVDEHDDHEYVDLGLPSGTLWATCNVGANAPEEYGDYFAWGETAPKNYYTEENYKWYRSDSVSSGYTKYSDDRLYGYNGFIDNKTELDPEDDAAYVNWGPSWRTPTTNQQKELIDKCTWTWTQRNGVNGLLATGPNGNTLFLPAAGMRWFESLFSQGEDGEYWSCTLYDCPFINCLYFAMTVEGYAHWGNNYPYIGQSVRAVRVQQN